ncbi:MAG: protein adenylyltransferase SelO [Planctomycetota bacterium]
MGPLRLDELQFDNRFTRLLPGDSEPANFRRQVRGACWSRVRPARVAAPRLLGWSAQMVTELDLGADEFRDGSAADVFSGNRLLAGMDPFAMCYGGHQFGNWAGQLGDGRAINLGEVVTRRGVRWMLQLKGAGPTPYSRTADGLAVLRSSLREFLCSEAMHHLGVPTTRALSLTATGEQVTRDMFYDGNPRQEPGAIVCRVAPSFTRFGNFQILAARRESQLLRQLIDYTITTDFPDLSATPTDRDGMWFREVCERTAELIVHWMRVGFVHGVMNTDNMSITGLTIDYGPYGWLEGFDPDWTPNTTDASGRRYAYGRQPQIALWNLVQLANALHLVVADESQLQAGIDAYVTRFNRDYRRMMAAKLGLWSPGGMAEPTDEATQVANTLQELMQQTETDLTILFRSLATLPAASIGQPTADDWAEILERLRPAWYQPAEVRGDLQSAWQDWLLRYAAVLQREDVQESARRDRMNQVNPKYVFRNYLAQLAIDRAEQGDTGLLMELLEVLRRPYDEQPEKEHLGLKRPEWARERAGCSMLSCSS